MPAAVNTFVGHAAELPVQFSCGSHGPVVALHKELEAVNTSVGHKAELPVQDSAGSHTPAEARQAEPAGFNKFAGQVAIRMFPDIVS